MPDSTGLGVARDAGAAGTAAADSGKESATSSASTVGRSSAGSRSVRTASRPSWVTNDSRVSSGPTSITMLAQSVSRKSIWPRSSTAVRQGADSTPVSSVGQSDASAGTAQTNVTYAVQRW